MSEVKQLETECREIRHLFWEFYAQNHLWFYLGSGAEENGYKPLHILPSRARSLIDFNFELTADKFLTKVKDALEFSIRSEMKYVVGSEMEPWFSETADMSEPLSVLKREYFLYLKENKIDKTRSPQTAPIDWGRIGFNWGGWHGSYCGPAWVEACDIFSEFGRLKHLKDKIVWVDKCLDLYHNNGRLLNKTAFHALEWTGDLDMRFVMKSWPEAAQVDKVLSIRVRIDNEIKKVELKFKQRQFPLSFFTHNLILRNQNRI
jgi:hypothetical protein